MGAVLRTRYVLTVLSSELALVCINTTRPDIYSQRYFAFTTLKLLREKRGRQTKRDPTLALLCVVVVIFVVVLYPFIAPFSVL